MGLCQSVRFECPQCGEILYISVPETDWEFGEAHTWYADDNRVILPPGIAIQVEGESVHCRDCNRTWRLEGYVPKEILMTFVEE